MRFLLSNRAARIALSISAVFVFLILVFRASLAVAADDGAELYKTKCQMCHGPDATGNTPAGKNLKVPDLTSAEVQKKPNAELADTIGKGRNKMPSFGKALKEDQIGQLVAHLRDLGKKK
jgi:cytochrome c6